MKNEYLIIWSVGSVSKKDRTDALAAVRKFSAELEPPAWVSCGSFLLVRSDRVAAALFPHALPVPVP